MTIRRHKASLRQNRPSVRKLQQEYHRTLEALVVALEAMQEAGGPYGEEGIAALTEVHLRRQDVDRAASLLLRSIGFNFAVWRALKQRDIMEG